MYKNILLAVDLSDEGSWSKALPTALALAQVDNATIHLMTVIPDYGMSIVGEFFPANYEGKVTKAVNEKLHAFAAEHIPSDVKTRNIVAHGSPYEQIIEMSEEAGCDLIVMAAHRPGLQDYLLGPNAARVVRHSKKSVLVVRD